MIRVGLHQGEPGSGFTAGDEAFYRAGDIGALVLPEYFWVRREDANHREAAAHAHEDVQEVAGIAARTGWLVAGGTFVELLPSGKWRNTCPLFHGSQDLGRYSKQHLMPGEVENGAEPGSDFLSVGAGGRKVAAMICADVLHPDTYPRLRDMAPDIILAPMASPYLEHDTPEAKELRDRELFLYGARHTGAVVVKVAGVGSLLGRPLQGRCLVAGPQGVMFRTPFDEELVPRRWIVEIA